MSKRQRRDSCSSASGSSSSSDRYKRTSKHLEDYNLDWKEQYAWLLPVVDRDAPGTICGLLCELCQRYKIVKRSGAGTWSERERESELERCMKLYKKRALFTLGKSL